MNTALWVNNPFPDSMHSIGHKNALTNEYCSLQNKWILLSGSRVHSLSVCGHKSLQILLSGSTVHSLSVCIVLGTSIYKTNEYYSLDQQSTPCQYQYINQESVCLCVCLSVTDVTHFRNVYSGNEATTCTVTLTLGTSPLSMTLVSCIAP